MLDISNNIRASHKFNENSISSHSLFKDKKLGISLEKNTKEIEKSVILEEKNKNKKAGKNLLKIIKSSEFHRKLFSERDSLSLIQDHLVNKVKVFNKTINSFEKNIFDLSIEDQRNKMNELLKKKLEIHQNKEKKKKILTSKSLMSSNFFRKNPVFNGNKTQTSLLASNINIRLKKSLEKAQKVHSNHEKKTEDFDLNGCFTKFSFHQN